MSEETSMIALEIIGNAGDARTRYMAAMKKAQNGEFEEAEKLIEEGNEFILKSHKVQTSLIQAEAKGEAKEMGFLIVHAQDHLMTNMLLRDVIENFITLYKRTT
ncbi:PTS lactose/cellobiose transporter subunit IIA [Halonatronum saccharophilum]|uniref:PTS lactose/cellobiose transporter subunit IIA n=1 Tax=Halonatronum saccharophilum TaxID=150060 RepID=UPI0004AE02E2|nr:PTS lactose/cellobiose transporter subunit IIA [Halonatronum saccharophilum]